MNIKKTEKTKVVFLLSGNGGNLRFFHYIIESFDTPFTLSGVIADRNCKAIEYAIKYEIPNHLINYSKKDPKELQLSLCSFNPDIIVTNIHKIIDTDTLGLFKDKFINLHYSLLPAFAGEIGMDTVDKAENNNVQFIGTSSHYLTEQVDAGRIISQSIFRVDWGIDKKIIYDIVFRSGCINLLSALFIHLGFANTKKHVKIIRDVVVEFSPCICFDFSEEISFELMNNEYTI